MHYVSIDPGVQSGPNVPHSVLCCDLIALFGLVVARGTVTLDSRHTLAVVTIVRKCAGMQRQHCDNFEQKQPIYTGVESNVSLFVLYFRFISYALRSSDDRMNIEVSACVQWAEHLVVYIFFMKRTVTNQTEIDCKRMHTIRREERSCSPLVRTSIKSQLR